LASAQDSQFRLRLALGFLEEAHADLSTDRWRSCVDSSQMSVENASKAILALFGPVGRTHAVADVLRRAIEANQLSEQVIPQATQLADLAEQLGWDVHMASDYGDETEHRTPWELFDEPAAKDALHKAEIAVDLAQQIIETVTTS
jgi:HEPN domain-containing protein